MKQSSDTLIVSNSQNPAVSEFLDESKKQLGEECEFTVKTRLKSMSPEGSEWTIVAVVPPGYEIDEEIPAEKAVDVTSMSQPLTEASMNVRKSMSKSSSKY